MALIPCRAIEHDSGVQVFAWGPMAAADTCEPLIISEEWPLLANVQFTGTFGGNVTFEGSNNGTNYATILSGGAPISASANSAFDFSSAMRQFRPAPGALVSAVTVTLCMRRGQ